MSLSFSEIILITLALGIIIGGILLLKQSANKFNLTPEQLKKIKKRNEELYSKEKKENKTDGY